MNHCIDCGRRVSTGRSDGEGRHVRCMACETARVFRGWYYPVTNAARRVRELERRIRELEANDGA